ncbi:NAD(+) diphosphatase [Microbacterium nymphoidis]|uniref:NAD(+) diphosphatase n=1 Tax=Microbacterium nymphoidis TaxID=2898586 RepID=UPI001E3F067C|nr:NAD(+) diphosphatase [Microbacterium nymphoidis]MCD2496952.1 NAD(+) diphosphatase [Microbacterium nymphoidis]
MEDASAPGMVAAFDRSADERTDPDLITRLVADADTRVLLIDADRAPVDAAGALVLVPVAVALDVAAAIAVADAALPAMSERFAFLGRRDGVAVLLAAVPGAAELAQGATTDGGPGPHPTAVGSVANADGSPIANAAHPRPTAWASLRVLHPVLAAPDGALLLEAVSLARWIVDAGHCAFCGAVTRITTGGWARTCTACGREHFPRTDPAVIVAVTDGDRLLLGSNAMWEQRRYSCFAGFVEAGESLEEAVRREVKEESGIDVEHVAYAGSQAWPFPRSLMLGFRAQARDARTAHPDGEEILDVRWFTRGEIRAAYAGDLDLLLPGKPSIAHELISGWAAETDSSGPGPAAGERA